MCASKKILKLELSLELGTFESSINISNSILQLARQSFPDVQIESKTNYLENKIRHIELTKLEVIEQ